MNLRMNQSNVIEFRIESNSTGYTTVQYENYKQLVHPITDNGAAQPWSKQYKGEISPIVCDVPSKIIRIELNTTRYIRKIKKWVWLGRRRHCIVFKEIIALVVTFLPCNKYCTTRLYGTDADVCCECKR